MNRLLVIGYGNTLRRDDGAGVRAAEAAAVEGTIDVVTAHGLQPEMAEEISRAAAVVFVDASVETTVLQCLPVAPGPGVPASHTRSPAELLMLAKALYGSAPAAAWQIAIPARDLGFGETLTDEAAKDVRAACALLRSIAAGHAPARSTV